MSSVSDFLMKMTARIDNQWGGSGTGFWVARLVAPEQYQVFLVTNKHVIWSSEGQHTKENVDEIRIHFTELDEQGGEQRGEISRLMINRADGTPAWREHPDADVDVVAIEATVVGAHSAVANTCLRYEDFLDDQKRQQFDVTAGDDVFVVGYPFSSLGDTSPAIRHCNNNFPLLRRGMISSLIGRKLEDDYAGRQRILRGFLVDGAVIPGSSGSPVILAQSSTRLIGNSFVLGGLPLLFLGMIAEARLAEVRASSFHAVTYAGLGFALDAETIKETIELFYQ